MRRGAGRRAPPPPITPAPATGHEPFTPLIRNNLVIKDGGDCARIRWANEISDAGLYGLEGSAGMDSNWFYNARGACNFADNRPGSPLADGGTLEQWRAYEKVDARSLTGVISVTAEGRLLPGSPAIDQGETLAQVTQDIDKQPRRGANDIGADEIPGPATSADRVMDWAEVTLPQYFVPGGVAGTVANYSYRYYASTGMYLATDGQRVIVHNGREFILLDVGPLSSFLALAVAAGF